MIARRVVVRGRVQGVGYRAFVADEAMTQRVEGWVRNRRDGTVEAVFSAPAEAVATLIETCRKGPWGARVDAIEEREATAEEIALRREGGEFSILPTV